ncbi:MAG: (2Fe-2S) ferredoxin domain-containing protein [Bacteroidota bacterium]
MSAKKCLILVCTSSIVHQRGGESCESRGATNLFELLRQKIASAGLADLVTLRSSACLNNCQAGITMKVFPQNSLYRNVTPDDLDDLIHSHFVLNKPLERLLVPRLNPFLGL